jgi:hypothetical protein
MVLILLLQYPMTIDINESLCAALQRTTGRSVSPLLWAWLIENQKLKLFNTDRDLRSIPEWRRKQIYALFRHMVRLVRNMNDSPDLALLYTITYEAHEVEAFEFVEKTYRRHMAAVVICNFLRYSRAKRNRKAVLIQRACHNWLYKCETADGKKGIWCRILERKYPPNPGCRSGVKL